MGIELTDDILKGWKVVVVDDEWDNLFIAQSLLESYGAEVHTAMNGEEGIALIKQVLPLFVVADVSMPKMDGQQMVKHLKADATTRDIPVIALSAGSMLEDRDQALAVGFHNYLIKPLTPQWFVSDLLNMLADVPSIAQGLANGR
ncbi:MAG: hypothetical protein OHK0046_09250 [Anaerolineae bacterium]